MAGERRQVYIDFLTLRLQSSAVFVKAAQDARQEII
jgi:hypothetical protein